MFHRLWTLIRKELQSLLREPQTRAILILPVLIQVLLFPFAATLEVTNATIAIYNEDNGKHAVELTQRFARAKAFTHILLLKKPAGNPADDRHAKSIVAGALSGRFFPSPG
ncbi:ABC transporter permease [Citrobacter koseri]|uniref:ABC transporter permease n=1 Tax=Citrobacter koseri TaxID=545 RepID=A0A2X2VAP2_CITKO|nr:ABC transporter permease [Citrobacter koseri]